MAGNSVRLHRVLRASPEKIYRAFLTPKVLEKWLPPKGFTAEFHLGWQESQEALAFLVEPDIHE